MNEVDLIQNIIQSKLPPNVLNKIHLNVSVNNPDVEAINKFLKVSEIQCDNNNYKGVLRNQRKINNADKIFFSMRLWGSNQLLLPYLTVKKDIDLDGQNREAKEFWDRLSNQYSNTRVYVISNMQSNTKKIMLATVLDSFGIKSFKSFIENNSNILSDKAMTRIGEENYSPIIQFDENKRYLKSFIL